MFLGGVLVGIWGLALVERGVGKAWICRRAWWRGLRFSFSLALGFGRGRGVGKGVEFTSRRYGYSDFSFSFSCGGDGSCSFGLGGTGGEWNGSGFWMSMGMYFVEERGVWRASESVMELEVEGKVEETLRGETEQEREREWWLIGNHISFSVSWE